RGGASARLSNTAFAARVTRLRRLCALPRVPHSRRSRAVLPLQTRTTMRRRHVLLLPILLALAAMAWQFFGAETFTNAETGERHRVGLSVEEESALGLQAYREVLATEHVVRDGPEVELVRRVA